MNNENLGAQFFHGSPSGDLRGGYNGLHVGTKQAASEALNARIGTPHEGEWDGTREYGKTLLSSGGSHVINKETGKWDYHPSKMPPRYPTGHAKYGDNSTIPLDSVPDIMPVRINGKMTNTPTTPHEDFKANGYMSGQIKRGQAKSGYYYTNVAEDEGSISAVVPPGGKHLDVVDRGPRQMRMF